MAFPRHAQVLILAGPNGAGKTTFAREYLTHEAQCPAFINADLIADGLSPFAPDRAATRAGRIMLELIVDDWTLYDCAGPQPVSVEYGVNS